MTDDNYFNVNGDVLLFTAPDEPPKETGWLKQRYAQTTDHQNKQIDAETRRYIRNQKRLGNKI